MAIADSYGLFWNSDSGDRQYDADSFEKWLKKFFTPGVFANDLYVSASSGMTVNIAKGYSNLWGKVGIFETASTLTLDAPHSIYPRIDTIVIERNDTDRMITLKVVKGQYTGSTPTATAPVRNETLGIYQLVLAEIYVGVGVSGITQANITDKRADTNVCGIITGTVEEMDFSQFVEQFNTFFAEWTGESEDAFDAWFDHMKDQISEDAAGQLQTEIDGIADSLYGFVTITVPTSGWSGSAPEYTVSIPVNNISENSKPFIDLLYPDGVTKAQKKAIDKSASKLVSLTTANNYVILTATEVPEVSFDLSLRGLGSGLYEQTFNKFYSVAEDNVPYVSREGHDGIVKIPQLVGGTVAWNQLIQNGNFSDGINGWNVEGGVTATVTDNVVTINSSVTYNGINQSGKTFYSNHKYLMAFDVSADSACRVNGTLRNSSSFLLQIQANTSKQRAIKIAPFNGDTIASGFYIYANENAPTTIYVSNIILIDLTQMFGTTIADYVYSLEQATEGSGIAWLQSYGFFTKDYYTYDAGSLQSVCTSARKITALDGTVRTYPIDNEELRGLFKLDTNNKLYADGDIYPSSGNGTRKYGIVDLGSLDWGYNSPNFGAIFSGCKIKTTNMVTSMYYKPLSTWSSFASTEGYLIYMDDNGRLYIKNPDYTTAATFKTAMSGVYLVYELATETTFSADPYINPQRSEGTEEFVDGLTRDVMIPVGNESTYYLSEVLPSAADYTDGQVAELALLKNYTRRTRRDITNDLAYLPRAVAEQNLEKYGYSIGDYFTGASEYTYFLADMNTFRGAQSISAVINQNHIAIVVKTGANSKWNETNDTSTGYSGSVLHTYLSGTVLDNIKTDMIALFGGTTGLEHLLSRQLLWTTSTSGSGWSSTAEYISALTEPQVYGTNVWAIDGYQTGEAWKHLELFKKFSYMEIFGWIWLWLRSIRSASNACYAGYTGSADNRNASNSLGVVGLILFK